MGFEQSGGCEWYSTCSCPTGRKGLSHQIHIAEVVQWYTTSRFCQLVMKVFSLFVLQNNFLSSLIKLPS